MKIIWIIGVIYLVVLNSWGFLSMGLDKRKAQKQAWRTPEKRFFLIAILGGSLGVWLGMQTFRHKTQHKLFTIGIPLIILAQGVGAIFIQRYIG